MATDPSSNPTLNLNEVEAQELHEHRYAAGTEVAGGAAGRGGGGGGRRGAAVQPALCASCVGCVPIAGLGGTRP